jgi:hypothetical protein
VGENLKMENDKTGQTALSEDLAISIGTEETSALTPAKVNIVGVNVQTVEKNGKVIGKKVVFSCDHPASKDNVNISEVKYETKGGQLKFSGTWFNKDSKGLLQKGSALAVFLQKNGANALQDMIGKNGLETLADEKGYLAFKAY